VTAIAKKIIKIKKTKSNKRIWREESFICVYRFHKWQISKAFRKRWWTRESREEKGMNHTSPSIFLSLSGHAQLDG
jgi:hypothetical protein